MSLTASTCSEMSLTTSTGLVDRADIIVVAASPQSFASCPDRPERKTDPLVFLFCTAYLSSISTESEIDPPSQGRQTNHWSSEASLSKQFLNHCPPSALVFPAPPKTRREELTLPGSVSWLRALNPGAHCAPYALMNVTFAKLQRWSQAVERADAVS